GHVGVPAALVAVAATVGALVPAPIDGQDLGVVVDGVVLERVGVRDLAEVAGEGDLLGVVDLLPAQEHDLVAEERLLDALDRGPPERLRVSVPLDLRADVTRYLLDLYVLIALSVSHCLSPPPPRARGVAKRIHGTCLL